MPAAFTGQVARRRVTCADADVVQRNSAIDRIAFSETYGSRRSISEIKEIAWRLLTENEFYAQTILKSQTRAKKQIGFEAIAEQLRDFSTVREVVLALSGALATERRAAHNRRGEEKLQNSSPLVPDLRLLSDLFSDGYRALSRDFRQAPRRRCEFEELCRQAFMILFRH